MLCQFLLYGKVSQLPSNFNGTLESKSWVLSSKCLLQSCHLVNTTLWDCAPVLSFHSPVTQRSGLSASFLGRGVTSGDSAPLASSSRSSLFLLMVVRSTGDRGTAGESQQGQPLQVILSRFVLKVSLSDTRTHVTIFIYERGRIFLNEYNFWLFPSKKKKKVSHSYSFLPASAPASHTLPLHKHIHERTQAHTYTSTQKDRPLVQQVTILRLRG